MGCFRAQSGLGTASRGGQSRGGRGWSVPSAPPSYLMRICCVCITAENSSHQSSCFHGADILESEGTSGQQNEQARSCHERERGMADHRW